VSDHSPQLAACGMRQSWPHGVTVQCLPSEPDVLPIRFRQAPHKIPPPAGLVWFPTPNGRTIDQSTPDCCSCAGAPQTIPGARDKKISFRCGYAPAQLASRRSQRGDRGRVPRPVDGDLPRQRETPPARRERRLRVPADAEPRQLNKGGRAWA
jgi:hypothetical protein